MLGIKLYNAKNETFFLQLLPDTKLSIQETLAAFDTQLENGVLSLPLEAPFTEGNRLFLGFAENLNTTNAFIPDYWRCDVYTSGVPYILDAKFKILNHKGRFDFKQGSFSCYITGIKGLFGSLIKNKKLSDLKYGGKITWDASRDSREYAIDVMKGNEPNTFEKLKFAPVAIEDFIDTERSDYMNEFVDSDIVNNTVINTIYGNGWTFGRTDASNVTQVVSKGNASYEDYRSVPFLNFFFVLRQVFIEHGFKPMGTFFDYPDYDKVHIFNTRALERYDYPGVYDVNTEINAWQHVPNMLVADFLVAVQNTFNLRIVFKSNRDVHLNFNNDLLQQNVRKNYTPKVQSVYDDAQRHEMYENGFKLQWNWDNNDSYASDKVKDMKDVNVLAEVELFSDISALPFTGITLDDTHFVFVIAENYYYNYNTSSSSWIAMFEQQEDYKNGKEGVSYSPQLSPMCAYYTDTGTGFILRQNIVATHQHGNYWNNAKKLVENDFGLRLFYIDGFTTTDYIDLPRSFCHNKDTNGVQLVKTSISWKAQDGLYNAHWKDWLTMLKNSWIVKARFLLNMTDIFSQSETDAINLFSNNYLVRQMNLTLPLTDTTELELVKL